MGISSSTLYEWIKRFPEISDALKRGKEPVDFKVENALLKSALGYYVTVKKPIKVRTEKQLAGKGKIVEESIQYVDEQMYIPPQTAAQVFWLKNRRSDKWRDKPAGVESTEAIEKLDQVLGQIKGIS